MSDTACASARSDFRNLSRAGVAANRSRASTRVPDDAAQGSIAPLTPSSTMSLKPFAEPAQRVRISSRDTEAIDGSASPRKPKVAIAVRSPSGIFEVACRSTLSAKSASSMPRPSSATRISRRPPASIATSIRFRPGVERVLDEFLHRRGRPLDHFAGGDAVNGQRIETANRHGAKNLAALSHSRGSGGSGALAVLLGIAMTRQSQEDFGLDSRERNGKPPRSAPRAAGWSCRRRAAGSRRQRAPDRCRMCARPAAPKRPRAEFPKRLPIELGHRFRRRRCPREIHHFFELSFPAIARAFLIVRALYSFTWSTKERSPTRPARASQRSISDGSRRQIAIGGKPRRLIASEAERRKARKFSLLPQGEKA